MSAPTGLYLEKMIGHKNSKFFSLLHSSDRWRKSKTAKATILFHNQTFFTSELSAYILPSTRLSTTLFRRVLGSIFFPCTGPLAERKVQIPMLFGKWDLGKLQVFFFEFFQQSFRSCLRKMLQNCCALVNT